MPMRRHRPDRGQVLVAALLVLAMFGVLAASILSYISGSLLQHAHTESTVAHDVLLEGAANFAASSLGNTANNPSSPPSPCGGPGTGHTTLPSWHGSSYAASYLVVSCIPNYRNASPGGNCVLCLLGTGQIDLSMPSSNATLYVRGEIDINGDVSAHAGAPVCSSTGASVSAGCAGTPEFIGVAGSQGSPAYTPKPPPPSKFSVIADPLQGLPLPSSQPVTAIVLGPNGTVTQIPPGTYGGVSVTGNRTLQLSGTGTYVFTGDISLSGNGIFDGTTQAGAGATVVMTCSRTAGGSLVSTPCSGGAGPALDLSGGGSYELNAPSSGPYAGISLFQDPNDSQTVSFGGSGAGNVVSGGLYAKTAPVDVGGNATGSFQTNGRLVAKSLTLHTNAGAGLSLWGGTIAGAGCDLYNATVTVVETPSTGSPVTRKGQVVFASALCAGGGGIVSFAYGP